MSDIGLDELTPLIIMTATWQSPFLFIHVPEQKFISTLITGIVRCLSIAVGVWEHVTKCLVGLRIICRT